MGRSIVDHDAFSTSMYELVSLTRICFMGEF